MRYPEVAGSKPAPGTIFVMGNSSLAADLAESFDKKVIAVQVSSDNEL